MTKDNTKSEAEDMYLDTLNYLCKLTEDIVKMDKEDGVTKEQAIREIRKEYKALSKKFPFSFSKHKFLKKMNEIENNVVNKVYGG